MIKFFKNLFNLNKIVKEIEAQKIEITLLKNKIKQVEELASKAQDSINKINNELVRLTNLENKFNEITIQ